MPTRASKTIALFLLGLFLGEMVQLVVDHFWQSPPFRAELGWITRLLFVGLCFSGLRICSVREWSLLALALGLSGVAFWLGNGVQIVGAGLDLAVFLGVFIALVTFLKEPAVRSKSVTNFGVFLTSQPPGKRFLSVAVGSHIMGALLNFGAVSLMAPLVQQGARHAKQGNSKQLEQRQMSALIRGFSWILLWAPTTLTQAVLLRLFTDVDYPMLIALGLGSAVLMVAIGRVMDRIEWPQSTSGQYIAPPPVSKSAAREILAVCASLLIGTFGLVGLTGVSVAEALIFVAPTITLVWLRLLARRQQRDPEMQSESLNTADVFLKSVPFLARSTIALGLSGFIGQLSANLLPAEKFAQWIDVINLSPWLFLCVLPVIITLGGQIALSPMLFVVFLGGVLATLPTLPADPTLIVFALSVGWALSMTASPNATATLLISAASNIPPTTLTWKWNGKYALVCYLVFAAMFYLLS